MLVSSLEVAVDQIRWVIAQREGSLNLTVRLFKCSPFPLLRVLLSVSKRLEPAARGASLLLSVSLPVALCMLPWYSADSETGHVPCSFEIKL